MARPRTGSTPQKQALILWALLVRENGGAFQNEVKPEPSKADRDALEQAGLITCDRRGRYRRFFMEVTDQGWAWAGDHLDAALPTASPAGSRILQAWLTRLKAYMDANRVALADILAPQPPAAAPPETTPESGIPAETTPPSASDHEAHKARIRNAYLGITGGRLNQRVFLADLRDRLRDIDRAALDESLKRMHLEDGSMLSGSDNPREITAAVRDAGVRFKGEDLLVLWITK